MTQLFDLNARIQQLTWSLILYEKYSTSLSTIVLVVLTTANFGGFSNFCRYYTRSQAGKSTGYRPTLKPLLLCFFGLRNFETIHHALCHHNSSHMLNEMFVQLSILREPNMKMCSLVVSSRYVFSCVICFRGIHFILISTAHALFLTCLPVSIYGT